MTESKFHDLAKQTATAVGRPASFFIAVAVIVLWVASGPLFHFSDTWQLIINTSTTIVTFLMVFLIQNTQNRDTKALQLKLDELLRANRRARNTLVDLESMTDDELQELQTEFKQLREIACEAVKKDGGHQHEELAAAGNHGKGLRSPHR
jgi:low affinity Fe/Cu permease